MHSIKTHTKMAIGLHGIWDLTPEQRAQYRDQQIAAGKISKRQATAENLDRLYRNQNYIKKYGLEDFNSRNAQERDAKWKRDIALEDASAFSPIGTNKVYSSPGGVRSTSNGKWLKFNDPKYKEDPFYYQHSKPQWTDTPIKHDYTYLGEEESVDSEKGTGNMETYNKIVKLATYDPDTYFKLKNSGWKTDPEMNKHILNLQKETEDNKRFMDQMALSSGEAGASKLGIEMGATIREEYLRQKNNDLFNNIYNEYLDKTDLSTAKQQEVLASHLLQQDNATVNIHKAFLENIKENNPTLYAYYDKDGNATGDMKEFDTEDEARYLAKSAILEQHLGEEDARLALSNYADRYLKGQQSWLKRQGLHFKEWAIKLGSYTAAKVSGIAQRAAQMSGDTVDVWMTPDGEMISNDKVHTPYNNEEGFYENYKGERIPVKKATVSLSDAMHNGIDGYGNALPTILNAKRWSDAERFNINPFNNDKEFEKANDLGTSTQLVRYNPGETQPWWTSTLQMSSFIASDALTTLLTGGAGKAMEIVNGLVSANAIGYQYEEGVYGENFQKNMSLLEERAASQAAENVNNNYLNAFADRYDNDKQFNKDINNYIKVRAAQLKDADSKLVRTPDGNIRKKAAKSDKDYENIARGEAIENFKSQYMSEELDRIKNSAEYLNDVTQATEIASNAASIAGITDAAKYAIVNTAGWRKYLFTDNIGRMTSQLNPALNRIREVLKGGKKRLSLDSALKTAKDKAKAVGGLALKHGWGGGWTNYTDEMQAEGGRQINEDRFTAYLNGEYDGEGAMDLYTPMVSYLRGALKAVAHPSTTEAGFVGAMSAFLPTPTAMIQTLTNKGSRTEFRRLLKNWRKNKGSDWLHLANMTFTNGILNDLTSVVDAEAEVQEGIDFVNTILDEENDFEALRDALAFDLAKADVTNKEDSKIMRFMEALKDMHLLHTVNLTPKEDTSVEDQALAKSTIIQDFVSTIDKISEGKFTEEEAQEYLKDYYAKNPAIPKSEENNQKALQVITENAQSLKEAFDIYEDVSNKLAEEQERQGMTFSPAVVKNLLHRLPLDNLITKQLNDNEEVLTGQHYNPTPDGSMPNPLSFGTKEARESHIRSINNYRESLEKNLRESQEKEQKAEEELTKYEKEIQKNPPADANDREDVAKKLVDLRAKHQAAVLSTEYYKSRINKAEVEKEELQKSIDNSEEDKVLSKDEIMQLGAVDRARMLDKNNRSKFSKAQQVAIEALEKELLMKDPSALDIIQEQSVLQRHLDANRSAYTNILSNPGAAAVELEAIHNNYLQNTVNSISQVVGESLNSLVEAVTINPAMSEEETSRTITDVLKKYDPAILKYFNRLVPGAEGVEKLSERKTEIEKALGWSKLKRSIGNAIKEMPLDYSEKALLVQSIDNIIQNTYSREEAEEALQNALSSKEVNESDRSNLTELLRKVGLANDTEKATAVETKEEKTSREASQKQQADSTKKEKEEVIKQAEESTLGKPESGKQEEVLEEGEAAEVDIDENTGEPIIKEQTPKEVTEYVTETPNIDKINKVNSPSIEQQVEEVNKDGETKAIVTELEPDTTDGGNELPVPSADNMLGNALYGYDVDSLVKEGKEVERTGEKPNDPMSRYFNWLKNAGIKLQEIIDYELKDIVKANPDIRFLYVNPEANATDDEAMKMYSLLAVEYTDKVARVHNKDRGGVVKAGNKDYLIIGTLGFDGEAQKGAFLNVVTKGRNARNQYFSRNPRERFFVDPINHTGIERISSGRLVKQNRGEDGIKIRRVSELLTDGMSLEDLKWLIQYRTKAAAVGVSSRNIIHTPTDGVGNAGNTFLLMEAANGEYSPVYIIPTMLKEISEGALKNEIIRLINKLTSNEHWQRYDAIVELCHWLYLDDDTNILIGTPELPTVTLIENGTEQRTFDLRSSDFTAQKFIDAIFNINPRINLTTANLMDKVSLKWLDEAGALTTDIARLGTSNVSYTVYAVDSTGNPIKSSPVDGVSSNLDEVTSDLNKANIKLNSQVFGGQTYRKEGDTWINRIGKPITNENLINQLNMNNHIRVNKLIPDIVSKEGKFFIIDSNLKNPIVWKQSRGDVVTVLDNAEASEVIDRINQVQLEKAREEAAKQELENMKKAYEGEEVGLIVGEEEFVSIPEEEGLGESVGETVEYQQEQTIQQEEPMTPKPKSGATAASSGKSLAELQQRPQPTNISTVMRDRRYMSRVRQVMKDKGFAGKTIPEMEKWLKSKEMPITNITNIEDWIKLLEECR